MKFISEFNWWREETVNGNCNCRESKCGNVYSTSVCFTASRIKTTGAPTIQPDWSVRKPTRKGARDRCIIISMFSSFLHPFLPKMRYLPKKGRGERAAISRSWPRSNGDNPRSSQHPVSFKFSGKIPAFKSFLATTREQERL